MPSAPEKPPRSVRRRSEASRRSSFTSFATAAALSERVSAAGFSSDDHALKDQDDEDDDDSSESETPEPFFTKRQSSVEKSPPTSQEEAFQKSTPRGKNGSTTPQDRRFLSPSPTPRRNGKPQDRLSKASHLTIPYDMTEAVDHHDKRSSRLRGTRSSSRINSTYLDEPFEDRDRRRRSHSHSERGASRNSRLAPPLPLPNLSLRNSYMSSVAPSSPSSVVGSPRKHASRIPPSPRRDYDTASIVSRTTAKGGKPSSVRTTRLLASESQVFPGTTIRKYVEPPLTEAMRSVLKQFSGRNMEDHACNGYPIAVFVGATALDTGSLMHPHVAGGVSLYFGAGHPKNMATILPEEDRIPRHIPNPKAPTPTSLSRRAELRAAITALETIYDLYRGRACAHICIDSAYVAKAWGTWIPTWELKGWPGEEREEDHHRRRDGYSSEGGRSRRRDDRRRKHDYRDRDDWLDDDPYERRRPRRGGGGYGSDRGSRRSSRRRRHDYSSDSDYSDYDDRRGSRRGGRRREDDYDRERRAAKPAPARKLVDEDLLRELADIRYEFAQVEMDRVGSAHLYLIDRTNNPADKMARAAVKNEAGLLAATSNEPLESESESEEEEEEERTVYEDTRSLPRGSLDHRRSTLASAVRSSSRMSERGTGPTQKSSRRLLDTFIEEDEDDARSRKSTRAEKERDRYLSRQLAPPAHGRYRDDGRGSLDALRSRSQPDFHSAYEESVVSRTARRSRRPAPEEQEYNWDARSTTSSRRSGAPKPQRSKPKQREWTMQTADDLAPKKKGRKKRDDDSDKRSIFSRMSIFGRKGKSER